MPEIGVVVLHHRNWPGVARTICSIQAQSVPTRIVLVDNASRDGSVEAIRAAFPDVPVVESPVNGGYAAGMNLGRRHLPPGDVLFATHEVELAPDCLAALAEHLVGRTGAVGPVLRSLDDRERVFSAGGYLDRQYDARHLTDVPQGPKAVQWLDGGCLLVSRSALEDVGPLDEGYFLYYEDVDYGFRLVRRGWRVECVPEATAWQGNSRPPPVLYVRNGLRFLARQVGRAAVGRGIAWRLKQAAAAAARGNLRRSYHLIAGVVAYVAHVPPRFLRQGWQPEDQRERRARRRTRAEGGPGAAGSGPA